MIELEEEYFKNRLNLLAVGAGKAGCVVSDELSGRYEELAVTALDTDATALRQLKAKSKIQIGSEFVRGFGTAENPETAKKAFSRDRERIMAMIGVRDIVFVIAGLGGGVGSGAAPLIAEAASEAGAVSVAIAGTPFAFEGKKRIQNSLAALKELEQTADALIIIPNEDLFSGADTNSFLAEAFKQAEEMILEAVKNICDIMLNPGVFNVDLPMIRQILGKSGLARFGVGEAEGENRWSAALRDALKSPMMKSAKVSDAANVLMHVSGGRDITGDEIQKISSRLFSSNENHNGVTGVTVDRKLGKKIKIRLLFTGIKSSADEISRYGAGQSDREATLGYDFQKKFAGVKNELDIPAVYRRKKRAE